jgi:hypothetical protein
MTLNKEYRGMKPKYENSVVYKIVCLDPTITDCYVGSTTNLTRRKYNHKTRCCNKSKNNESYHNQFVYRFIRDHGGWDNWQFVLVRKYKHVKTKQQLIQKERKYIDKLKPTLNRVVPLQTPTEYYQVHKLEYLEHKKKYRLAHPEWFKGKVECECGCKIVRTNIARHKKTKLHLDKLKE